MRDKVYHGEVDINYILRKSSVPSDILIVSFPGSVGDEFSAGHIGYTYMLTIGKFKVNALYLKSSKDGFSKSQMTAINRDFVIERTVVALIRQSCEETGATRVIVIGSSMGGMCSVYYGLKYDYDIIACSPKYEHPSVDNCLYAAGGTSPEDFAWYHSLMSGAIKAAGERAYSKRVFLCWGKGEGNWILKNQGPKMLTAFEEASITYHCKLYDYSSHLSLHRLFPEILNHQLATYLDGSNCREEGGILQTATEKTTAAANRFKQNLSVPDSYAPVARGHTAGVKTLPFVIKFKDYVADLCVLKNELVIIIASRDTHAPKENNGDLLTELSKALEINDISSMFRCSYLAIIDGGIVVTEQYSTSDTVEAEYEFNETKVVVQSRGWIAGQHFAKIFIDNKQTAVNMRGLNFVIIEKKTGKVIDSVNFDTFAETKDCIRFRGLYSLTYELAQTELNYAVRNRFNHGDCGCDLMLKTFVYAAHGYHWLPGLGEPYRHEAGDYWQSLPLKNNNYANSFWFQSTVLNHYKVTNDPAALKLIAENLTQFFSVRDLVRATDVKDVNYWWTALKRTEFFIDFMCLVRERKIETPFSAWDMMKKEIIATLRLIINVEILLSDINKSYFRLNTLLTAAELFKANVEFHEETYKRVMKAAVAMTDYYFDDNGVCIYQQVRVQHCAMPNIRRIIDFAEANSFESTSDFKKLKRKFALIERASGHMVCKDGITPNLGHSDLVKTATAPAKGNFCKSSSNIVILSDDLAYITVHGGSNINSAYRHCDLLSFTFKYDGKQLVFDAGGGEGALADYANSAVAHSALICDEQDYITPDYFDWTAIDDAAEHDAYVFVATKHVLIEGVTLSRKLLWLKPNILVIYDEAESENEHLYTQNFLFPNLKHDDNDTTKVSLEVAKGYTLTITQLVADDTAFKLNKYSGTTNTKAPEKDLRGSRVVDFKKLEKLLNLAYTKHGSTVKFLTVLEAHSGKEQELTFGTATVEHGSLNVTATDKDSKNPLTVVEKLFRGFRLF